MDGRRERQGRRALEWEARNAWALTVEREARALETRARHRVRTGGGGVETHWAVSVRVRAAASDAGEDEVWEGRISFLHWICGGSQHCWHVRNTAPPTSVMVSGTTLGANQDPFRFPAWGGDHRLPVVLMRAYPILRCSGMVPTAARHDIPRLSSRVPPRRPLRPPGRSGRAVARARPSPPPPRPTAPQRRTSFPLPLPLPLPTTRHRIRFLRRPPVLSLPSPDRSEQFVLGICPQSSCSCGCKRVYSVIQFSKKFHEMLTALSFGYYPMNQNKAPHGNRWLFHLLFALNLCPS